MIDKDYEFKEKYHKDVFLARGGVLEISTIIEKKFNEIILKIGKKSPKKMRFNDKAKYVENLMLKLNPEIKKEDFKTLQEFVALRNIFAHAPIKWNFLKLEFESEGQYKTLFKMNSEWEKLDIAMAYFDSISEHAINLIESFIRYFNTHIKMKREINKAVFGVDMSPEMEEKIYRIGNKLKQDMEEKRKALRGERELGNEFGFEVRH